MTTRPEDVAELRRLLAEADGPLAIPERFARFVAAARKSLLAVLDIVEAIPVAEGARLAAADELAEWIFREYVKAAPAKAVPFAEMRERLREFARRTG